MVGQQSPASPSPAHMGCAKHTLLRSGDEGGDMLDGGDEGGGDGKCASGDSSSPAPGGWSLVSPPAVPLQCRYIATGPALQSGFHTYLQTQRCSTAPAES